MLAAAHHQMDYSNYYSVYAVGLQNNFDPLRFAGGVVSFHTAFALLEKRRIENYEEKGEVCFVSSFSSLQWHVLCWSGSWNLSSAAAVHETCLALQNFSLPRLSGPAQHDWTSSFITCASKQPAVELDSHLCFCMLCPASMT